MNFAQSNSVDDLLTQVNEVPIPAQSKEQLRRLLTGINAQNYARAVEVLEKLGMTSQDANRIFRYPSGRFKFNNKMKEVTHQNVPSILGFVEVSPSEGLYGDERGLIIPVSFDGRSIRYEPGSDYYLFGYQALVIPSIYDYVQSATSHRVDTDSIDVLLRYVPPEVNFILDLSTGLVHQLEVLVIHPEHPEQDTYLRAMMILDEINQPYPKGYLIEDGQVSPSLLKFINQPSNLLLMSLLAGTNLGQEGNTVYERLGKRVCQVENIMLTLNTETHELTEDNPAQNNSRLARIASCQHDYAIIGVGIKLPTFNHQMIMILNTNLGTAFLFDPGYYREVEFPSIYSNIVRYFRRKLSRMFPDLKITSIDELSCPLVYSFQHNVQDKYCVAWSIYLSVLFLLNEDKSPDEIVSHIYQIGREGLKVVVPRFLYWQHPDEIEYLMSGALDF